MFKKILIVFSEKLTPKHKETIEKVQGELGEKISDVVIANSLTKDLFQDKDLIITIGGDGVFIRAACFLKETPILGINSEPEFSEGALTSIDETQISSLKKILNGGYKIKEMERIKITKNNTELPHFALDEIYVGASTQFHTSRYKIKCKGKEEEQRSSGVIIATSSGSNAWYKSAGGKPFTGKGILRFLVREPFCSERVFKPTLLTGEIKSKEFLEFEGKRFQGGILALDSNEVIEFKTGDKIKIELSNCPLNVLIID